MPRPCLALLACLLATACVGPDMARLPGGDFRLLPAATGPSMEVWHNARIVANGKTEEGIMGVFNSREQGLRVMLLEPGSMVTLWEATLSPDGAVASAGPLAARSRMSPAQVLSLVQLSNWPEADLRRNLGGGLRLVREGDATRVLDGDRVTVEVTKSGDATRVRLPTLEVEMTLTPATP